MPTSVLYERLEQSAMWKHEWQRMLSQAKRNGNYKKGIEKQEQNAPQNNQQQNDNYSWLSDLYGGNKQNKIKTYLGTEEQIPTFRLLVRMLSTIEMIIKDPDADIVLRSGDKEYFKAALKLFEKVTLPKYFGILFEQDLFDDYDYVEPFPSWE